MVPALVDVKYRDAASRWLARQIAGIESAVKPRHRFRQCRLRSLRFGRAIGETMIVVIASGNAALLDASLGHSARTITATIAQELGEVVIGSAHYDVLFALGAMLFVATFVVNLVGERIVHGMRRKLGIVS